MIIYLTGIDGSGKSTITKRLLSDLGKKDLEVSSIWGRYKPNIVKKIISPFKKKFADDAKNDHLMDGKQYSDWMKYKSRFTKNIIVSRSLFFLQAFDYSRQLKKFEKIITGHEDNKIVVIDRYLLDFIVDETINYGNIEHNFVTRRLLKKLKNIDHVFFINVSEETAMKRKDDIPSIEYLRERKKIYQYYIAKLDNCHLINNEADINATINEINRILNI